MTEVRLYPPDYGGNSILCSRVCSVSIPEYNRSIGTQDDIWPHDKRINFLTGEVDVRFHIGICWKVEEKDPRELQVFKQLIGNSTFGLLVIEGEYSYKIPLATVERIDPYEVDSKYEGLSKWERKLLPRIVSTKVHIRILQDPEIGASEQIGKSSFSPKAF